MATQSVLEAARQVPVAGKFDVIVCGGGPAGLAAAVAAGRAGAKVMLIESHGCLGGIWTAGALPWLLDVGNKGGLLTEILQRLAQRGACQPVHWTGIACDPEELKLLLEELCAEAKVRVRLHTRICSVIKDGTRVRGVVTESKSGREAWEAAVTVDCTGDGDAAAQAGCSFDFGRDASGESQPMSLLCILAGVEDKDIPAHLHIDGKPWRADCEETLKLLRAKGVEPSYGSPVFFRIHLNLFALMANHQYGVCGLNADDVTRATLEARAEVNRIVRALRAHGGAWANLRLVATGEQIGVREGRRIHGRYTVTVDDLIEGRRQDDAVCRVTFPVDIHSTSKAKGTSFGSEGVKAKPYDIPVRALIAKDVDGLMMAGRCISGDFFAHASYRVTGNATAMGEAAGIVAARAAAQGVFPHEVRWAEVAPTLQTAAR